MIALSQVNFGGSILAATDALSSNFPFDRAVA